MIDPENSDSRVQSRTYTEIMIKFKNDPWIPKKEKKPKLKYTWTLIQTENYAVRYNSLYNNIWIYRCGKVNLRLREKTCNFVKMIKQGDAFEWLIYVIETNDALLLQMKGFGKNMKFYFMDKKSLELTEKNIKSEFG
jgi:hypothetical protein